MCALRRLHIESRALIEEKHIQSEVPFQLQHLSRPLILQQAAATLREMFKKPN